MPTPSCNDSKEKLIEDMRSTAGSGSRQFDIAKAILDIKAQEDISGQTKKLTKATLFLTAATVALVLATIGLILVSAKIK